MGNVKACRLLEVVPVKRQNMPATRKQVIRGYTQLKKGTTMICIFSWMQDIETIRGLLIIKDYRRNRPTLPAQNRAPPCRHQAAS